MLTSGHWPKVPVGYVKLTNLYHRSGCVILAALMKWVCLRNRIYVLQIFSYFCFFSAFSVRQKYETTILGNG